MEDLYKDCKITDEEEKKELILRYIDVDSEDEWKYFESFKNGTWDEFKDEIVENYPDASNAAGGTLVRLEKIIKQAKEIQQTQCSEFLAFKRKFTVEANKLLIPPACISNRELVQKFLGCLSFEFHREIISHLAMRQSLAAQTAALLVPPVAGAPPAAVVPIRRKEDQYDLQEVIREATEVAMNFHGSLAVSPSTESRVTTNHAVKSENSDPDEIQLKYANLLDRIGLMAEEGAKTRKSIEEVLKTLQQSSASFPSIASIPSPARPSPVQNNQGQSMINEAIQEGACFYCWLMGHRVGECPSKYEHLEQNKIKIVDGKWRLDDGNWVPRDPTNKSPRDKVEAIHALRRQSQNYLGYSSSAYNASPGGQANTPGIVNMGAGDDYGQLSIYTNHIVDHRDELIDKLRNQLVSSINVQTQSGSDNKLAMVHQPQPTLSSEFVQQMNLLMGHLNLNNGGSNSGNSSGNDDEHKQFAILRSGNQGSKDERTSKGF